MRHCWLLGMLAAWHCCLLGRTGLGVRRRRGAVGPRWRGSHPGRLAQLRRGSPGGSGKRPTHAAALLYGGRYSKPAPTYAPEAADHPALRSKKAAASPWSSTAPFCVTATFGRVPVVYSLAALNQGGGPPAGLHGEMYHELCLESVPFGS